MSDYLVTDTELTSIADAIRTKGGTSADLSFPTGFVNAINAIPTGLDYEEGSWVDDGYSARSKSITLNTQRQKRPFLVYLTDDTFETPVKKAIMNILFFSPEALFGHKIVPFVYSDKTTMYYALQFSTYTSDRDTTINTSEIKLDEPDSIDDTNALCMYYYKNGSDHLQFKITKSNIPAANYIKKRTYRWIAIWK